MDNPHNNEDIRTLSFLKKGDRMAFNTLFRKYYPLLCAYCKRFLDIEDSEEVVQDIMLGLWENREKQEIKTSLSHYLFKAVYHGALARISRKKLKHKADTFFYKEMQEMFGDVDVYAIKELEKRIDKAIETLPPTYKQAFVMHRFHHMSYKEIAETFNVSAKTIDYRMQQALKQLRIELKDYLPLLILGII